MELRKLFDDGIRTDFSAKKRAESIYHFLNRSAAVDVSRIREKLEKWWLRHPAVEIRDNKSSNEFLGRFRGVDWQHQGAFFELVLVQMLTRLGCRLEQNPVGSKSKKTPDFLVHPRFHDSFYLEAAVVPDSSEEEQAEERRRQVIYAAIDEMSFPGFLIGIRWCQGPASSPSAGKVERYLRKKFRSVSVDEIQRAWDESDAMERVPTWIYRQDGWNIGFFPIPIREAECSEHRRLIGMEFRGGFIPPRHDRIRKAVREKGNDYGALDLPFVVAVNVLDQFAYHADMEDALLGSRVFETTSNERTGELYTREIRLRNGALMESGGPVYRRISGILACYGLSPWNVVEERMRLLPNPWASLPYDSVLTVLPRGRFNGGGFDRHPGIIPAFIRMDLEPSWLEGDVH